MFGSGSDLRYESSGPSRPLLIPTRFIWPYGGRQVLISGSFTRWLKLIPMIQVEGHHSVFQVIWNLSPGYHQYKFFIDGEWMYDQHQPFVCENYGVVNTIFLAPREGDLVPTIYSPEPVRSNMDIDNDVMPVSGGIVQVPIPRISQADLELSRHRLSVFMSKSTAYELLPESGKVVALDTNLPLKEAFSILYEQGIPTAPTFDTSKSQFVGVLSALDFILILREVGKLENRETSMTEEQLGTLTIDAWKEWKLRLTTQIDGSGRSHTSSLIHAGPNDSLKEVALKILQNNVATVPIILSSSASADCSFPQLLHPASLSGILMCICRQFRNFSSSLPVLQQPICTIPLGTWVTNTRESNGRSLTLLKTNASLGDALSLLLQAEVSSLPIVNENDSLVDIFSRCDISAMARHRAYTTICLDEISIYQAIQLGRPTNSPYGIFTGQRCHMCLRSDPLQKVMEQLAIPGVRRLVIVEAGSKHVQGIISLSDVFKFLLR